MSTSGSIFKWVQFSSVLPSESLSPASWPKACDRTRTLFLVLHPVLLSEAKNMMWQACGVNPSAALLFWLTQITPPTPSSHSPVNRAVPSASLYAQAAPDTSSSAGIIHHTTPPVFSHNTDVWRGRWINQRKRQNAEIRCLTLSPVPPKNFNYCST